MPVVLNLEKVELCRYSLTQESTHGAIMPIELMNTNITKIRVIIVPVLSLHFSTRSTAKVTIAYELRCMALHQALL